MAAPRIFNTFTTLITVLILTSSPPATLAAKYQQYNPFPDDNIIDNPPDPAWVLQNQNNPFPNTPFPKSNFPNPSDPLWPNPISNGKMTNLVDPWLGSNPDPLWTNVPDRSGQDPLWTTKDPWTKVPDRSGQDPLWTTKDPWTNVPKGGQDPLWTTPDPWTAMTTKDPWIQPAASTTPDPWTNSGAANSQGSTHPVDAINTINVISSAYVSNQQNTANGYTGNNNDNGVSGRAALNTGGSTATCQAAIQQCSLFDVDSTSLNGVYQQAFVTMLQKQRLQYQADLKKARDYFINMFNQLIVNPENARNLGNAQSCAQAASTQVVLYNDPTSGIPSPDSIADVTVTPPADCVVSQWSAWSVPLGFGVVERNRTIIRNGQCCPDDLVQRLDISEYLNGNNNVFENPDNVAENFDKDFLTSEPRDILLVIDTSSSIFIDDFELMKDGIRTMIDLFCGGFGTNVTSNNRLALLQFSTQAYVHHYFSDPQTPEALKAAVSKMVGFGGRTCTGDALIKAHDEIFLTSKGARANVPNDTLVITDGHANCGAELLQATRKLQERSQSVYALGIGIANDALARNQVKSLVTGSDDHHIFSLARYLSFKEMIDYIRIRQNGQTCIPIITKTQNKTGRK